MSDLFLIISDVNVVYKKVFIFVHDLILRIMKKHGFKWITLVSLLFVGMACVQEKPSERSLMIVFNEDNDHYFKLDSTLMTQEALEGYIDRLATTKVTHFFMCPNGQRTSYDSQVDEPIWAGVNDDPVAHSWCINAGILYRKGIDPYAVWTKQCRKRGISPWITVRMNDGHGLSSTRKNYRNTQYWHEHPELRRVPETVCDNGWKTAQLMVYDYSKPVAYQHHLDLVRELLTRYDVDGVELDWMRNPYLLTPGKEQEQSGILTQFMRDVRAMVDSCQKERGHTLGISVRVPTTLEITDAWGFNVGQWAEEGLIDMLVPTAFYNSIDTKMPIEAWRELLSKASKPVALLPGTDYHMAAYEGAPRIEIPAAVYYGWAADLIERGVDGLYFFNMAYSNPLNPQSPLYTMLCSGFTPEQMKSVRRRHPVTYPDWRTPDDRFTCQLPCTTDQVNKFTIYTGERYADKGYVSLLIGLQKSEDIGQVMLPVTLNGIPATRQFTYAGNIEYFSSRAARFIQYIFPMDVLRQGKNEVEVGTWPTPQQIEWVELQVNPADAAEYYEI